MVAQQDANIVEVNKFCGKTSNIMMIKGKRTKRSRPLSPLALTMSSTTTTTTTITVEGGANLATVEEWIPPLSSDASTISEEEDMAHCLILLAKGSNQNITNNNTYQKGTISNNNISTNMSNNENTSYECKTCNKSFSSFQALGGHRTSHKKPKPTLTLLKLDKSSAPSSTMFSLINTDYNHHNNHRERHFDDGDTTLSLQVHRPLSNTNNTNHHHHTNSKGNKVHECGICGAEFSSGQALGGHMRRHRPIGTSANNNIPAPLEEVTIGANNNMIKEEKVNNTRNLLSLDLNLPAPEDEQNLQHLRQSSSKFVFSSNEKTLVFSASSQLVDCHY